MKHKLLLACMLALLLAANLHATIELRARQLTTNEGLPSNSVRYICQDSKGFLWLGTMNGLCRYDGNSFITFQPEPDNPQKVSLADNRINKLVEDNKGFLWIGTLPELYSCYDLQNARFVDYTGCGQLGQNYSNLFFASNGDTWLWHKGNGARRIMVGNNRTMNSEEYKTEHNNLSNNSVLFMEEDAAGRIWLGTQKGLTFVHNGNSSIVNDQRNFSLGFLHNNTLYFVTENGDIFSYNDTNDNLEQVARLSTVAGKLSVSGKVVLKDRCIFLTSQGAYNYDIENKTFSFNNELNFKRGRTFLDNKGNYWIYNHTGHLYYINSQSGSIKDLHLIPESSMQYIDNERYSVVHDSHNLIWISTYGNGLYVYNPQTEELNHFATKANELDIIGSDYMLCVMEDAAKGIWVSQEHVGLSHISITNQGITRIYPDPKAWFGSSNNIRMVSQLSNGDIWVGTRNGELRTYNANLMANGEKHSFPVNIYALQEDSIGTLWMGSRGIGLRVGNTWHHRNPNDATTLAHSHIFSIFRDSKNRMWIGTFGGGLDLAIPNEDGSFTFRHFLRQSYGQRNVRTIVEDENGMMWVGTSDGICIFHPDSLIEDGNNYQWFNHTNGKFCSNEIRCLYRDSAGRMWVGTSGAGLSLCKPTNNYTTLEYKNYRTSSGLVNDVVQSILEDKMGLLWIATEYGISRFNPSNQSFESYFFSPYKQGNVYSESSSCICQDGRLLFGTNYGLILIDPEMIPVNQSFSPVVFTGLRVNGTVVTPETEHSPLTRSLSYSDEIVLKYFQNSFELNFSTLDFSDKGQTKYVYWLENYDKDWGEPSPLSFASYKYLDAGSYVLHVKSSNDAGVWDENETCIKIIIKPPFWKSNWAMMIYILLFAAALYFAYRIILSFNQLRNRIAVEKQLTEYKLVFFTNISHEFRTPLTLIQGAIEKMQRVGNIPEELLHPLSSMNKSTQRLLRLVNQLLEFRKMQNNKLALSLEETDVMAFLYEIFLSFKDVAEQKTMNFHFHPSTPTYKMYIDKSNLDKVVYNLLSNAIKYTPSGGTIILTAKVDETNSKLMIKVSDTGVGIPKEKQNELFKRFMQSNFSRDSIGVGLHLSHELVLVHKGTISYNENDGGGSVFIVELPTDKNVYSQNDFLVQGSLLLKEEDEHQTYKVQDSNEEQAAENRVVPLNKRKVLIIEDDHEIRGFLKEEMSVYFEVEVAEDGVSGFEKACNYDADLIICDVLMPGMTGFELTKKLKSDFATSHIPIILLTALNSAEKHLEGIEAGADAYIAKPFRVKILQARAFQLIEQRDKLREKFSNEPGIVYAAMCSTDRDKEFNQRLAVVLEANLCRADFSVEEFAQLMKLGRTVFYKKLRGITGYSPNEYLRVMRMKKAAELLLSVERYTVAEVSYKVGINDPFYFSKCFKSQFGISPSVYQKGGKGVEAANKEEGVENQ